MSLLSVKYFQKVFHQSLCVVLGAGFFFASPQTHAADFKFNKVKIVDLNTPTSAVIGPDSHLYVAYGAAEQSTSINGTIKRFRLDATGKYTGVSETIKAWTSGRRTLGLAFDPDATASNLVLWASSTIGGTTSWNGRIHKLVVPATGSTGVTTTDVIVGLPVGFHEVNGIVFGPDKHLYISVGSTTRMGSPELDEGWTGEHKLSAAILRADVKTISGTLNVKTTSPENYNPSATGAKVTLWATGIRNAYDLVYASNGNIYVGINQQAASDTPGDREINACCSQGALIAKTAIHDVMAVVKQGKYYGHINPTRCECVIMGGNPTSGTDPWEQPNYAVGTQPLANFDRSLLFDVRPYDGRSMNGIFQYNLSGNPLHGRILCGSYSGTSTHSIFAFGLDSTGRINAVDQLKDATGAVMTFKAPLDITQNSRGQIFVCDFSDPGTTVGGALFRLDPVGGNTPPSVSLTSPSAGSAYTAPASIPMAATASDTDGTISKVEFFNGTTLISSDTSSPYSQTWSNVAAGSYSLSAKATDNGGSSSSSPASAVTVNASSNPVPTVTLTSPANGATYTATATVPLAATASDSNGTITKVEFFNGTSLLNADTSSPYAFSWANVGGGTYSLTAKATDNGGASNISIASNIDVNARPVCSITGPASGTTFASGEIITITGTASDPDGSPVVMEFFANGTKIGEDADGPGGGADGYRFNWTGAPVGSHSLTIRITDDEGATGTSSAINITVSGGTSSTTTLTPVADTFVRDGTYVSSNFGTSTVLEAKNNTGGSTRRIFLKFDISSLGTSAVSNAKLRLYGKYNSTGSGPAECYSIADDAWTETGLTWNNQPAAGSMLSRADVTETLQYWEWDVTSFLQSEKNSSQQFLTLLIRNDTITGSHDSFNSKEAASNKPQLVIVSDSTGGTGNGSLTATKALQPGSLSLSTEGSRDWSHWGLNASTDWNHKSGITAQISNITKVGTGTVNRYTDGTSANSWSGGTPTASVTSTTAGIYVGGVSNGFQVTVPADTTSRSLKVYCGVWKATGKLEATLSDGSAAALVDTSHGSTTGSANTVFTINYNAASAGQSLTVKWTVQTSHDTAGGGTVGWQAATLQ